MDKRVGMVHHIEIYVSDLSKSNDFWGWLLAHLGYARFQVWEKGFSWKKGDTYLVFVQAEAPFLEAGYHRCRIGLNHLAFFAESREHVDRLTQMLLQKGIRLLYMDKYPHAGGEQHYVVFFEDPDRIKVEVVAPE
jgi:catechol 2,3-dioxygenase-like lactoylglutathione lyase family enzyme